MKKWFVFLFAMLIAGSTFAQTIAVEFQVDMSVKILKGTFSADTGKVTIAGTFNNWNNSATVLEDGDGDSIYTAVIDTFTTGDTFNSSLFKMVVAGKMILTESM